MSFIEQCFLGMSVAIMAPWVLAFLLSTGKTTKKIMPADNRSAEEILQHMRDHDL